MSPPVCINILSKKDAMWLKRTIVKKVTKKETHLYVSSFAENQSITIMHTKGVLN